MTPTVTWDSTAFVGAMHELAQISGRTFADVCKREMAAAVRICASEVKITPEKTVRSRVTRRYMAKFETPAGKISDTKRDTWFKEEGDDTFIPVGYDALPRMTVKSGPQAGKRLTGTASRGWHVSGYIWGAAVSGDAARKGYIKAEIPKRLRARFVGLQSWVQIGDALGLDLNSVPPQTKQIKTQEARDAADRKGRTYRNGQKFENSIGPSYELTIVNESPVEIKKTGQARLNSALDRRAKAFENNVAHKVFQDVKARMARYPGMFVTGDTAPVNE
jgi:hypothetical protein